jgi:hypothetical protein
VLVFAALPPSQLHDSGELLILAALPPSQLYDSGELLIRAALPLTTAKFIKQKSGTGSGEQCRFFTAPASVLLS